METRALSEVECARAASATDIQSPLNASLLPPIVFIDRLLETTHYYLDLVAEQLHNMPKAPRSKYKCG